MAIDMTTVKAISYNNKDVVKIEDGQGNILWQQPPSWTTLWEGSLTSSLPSWGSTSENNKEIVDVTGYTGVHEVRISFSNINAGGSGTASTGSYYTVGSTTSTTKPTSPVIVSIDFSSTTDQYKLGARGEVHSGTNMWAYAYAWVRRRGSDGRFLLTGRYAYSPSGAGSGSPTATITVTKIEIK